MKGFKKFFKWKAIHDFDAISSFRFLDRMDPIRQGPVGLSLRNEGFFLVFSHVS